MNQPTESRTDSRSRRKPSWPKILSRTLPSGNTQWRIDTQVDGQRIYESFKAEAEAITRAWEMFNDRKRAGKAGFELPMTQRVAAAAVFKKLAAYPDASLEDAVNFYIERRLRYANAPTIKDGIEQIITAITDKRSVRTVDNLRARWRKFAETFGSRQFPDVEPDEITAWLDSVASHPETRHNYRRQVIHLFNIAITEKRWCKENPAKDSRKDDRQQSEPEVFTIEELRRVLHHSAAHGLLPYVVLGTFCGIRVAELCRLDWQNVKYADRSIVIRSETAKTRTRRVVSLNDTGAAWLALCVKKSGPVVEIEGLRDALLALREDAELKRWPTNIMRHSFGSYALQKLQDAGKVAFEMGNSPRMIEKHYRQVVSNADAERFWQLRPAPAASNVVPMTGAAKG